MNEIAVQLSNGHQEVSQRSLLREKPVMQIDDNEATLLKPRNIRQRGDEAVDLDAPGKRAF